MVGDKLSGGSRERPPVGAGQTIAETLKDYVKSLCEYYELLSEQTDTPTTELFGFIGSYLQPLE